jgi:protein TBF1
VLTEVPIKYESPYSTTPPVYEVPQSPLKRRLSDIANEVRESDGKRQRIEAPATNDTIDLESIIAQATAKAEQSFTNSVLQGVPQADGSNATEGLLAQLIEHGHVTEHTAGGSSSFSSDPQLYMRILSLPMLESLVSVLLGFRAFTIYVPRNKANQPQSTQILSTLAQGPYSETIKIITQPDSELGQAYATLKSLFDQTKKIYSQQKPFLSANELSISEPGHRATIRTTNLATFVSSVFGGQDVGFYELNDHFIDTFVPHGEELKKEPGMLYLNLKTQMYLSAVSQEEQEMAREEILDELFPAGFEELLLARHAETPLTPSEVEIVNEAKARRDYLLYAPGDVDSICKHEF